MLQHSVSDILIFGWITLIQYYFPALVAYDALLSFPKEARCMWNRRFGAVTILYPLIRYGTIVDILLQVLDGFYIPRVATVSIFVLTPIIISKQKLEVLYWQINTYCI